MSATEFTLTWLISFVHFALVLSGTVLWAWAGWELIQGRRERNKNTKRR
jgi:hypothetical protein